MWRTPSGDRVLDPAEWALFREGLSSLWDWVENTSDDAHPYEAGVRVFDRLQPGQKLALMALVGRALSDPSVATPRHTAANEATVAAVFAHLRECVQVEAETGPGEGSEGAHWHMRGLILAAFREADPDWGEPLPGPESDDLGEWDLLLECLEGRVLWDADYGMGDEFLDMPPEDARELLARMTIDPDYYMGQSTCCCSWSSTPAAWRWRWSPPRTPSTTSAN